MDNTQDLADAKVAEIFRELVGAERAERLNSAVSSTVAIDVLGAALSEEFGTELAHDIGFHLADWNNDAAFLVAVHLFPERFTAAEIQDGVLAFMLHVPNHTAAAAKLYGQPVRDVFGVGSLEDQSSDT